MDINLDTFLVTAKFLVCTPRDVVTIVLKFHTRFLRQYFTQTVGHFHFSISVAFPYVPHHHAFDYMTHTVNKAVSNK